MEQLEDYIEDILFRVKAGRWDADEIIESFSELGLDEDEVETFVMDAIEKHGGETYSKDVKALIEVFDDLAAQGYITLHCAGYHLF